MAQDICKELFKFEEHCVHTDQPQVAELAHEAQKEIQRQRDRLAQYERDLHDDIGKDRSQDTDWLRAGFLQRGAQIERLEDGIRALANSMDEHSAAYHAMWKDGYAQYYEGRSDQSDEDCSALRGLLREDD